jgi:hypothetical protein
VCAPMLVLSSMLLEAILTGGRLRQIASFESDILVRRGP